MKRFFRDRSGATPAGSRHRPVAVHRPRTNIREGRQAGRPVGGARSPRNPRSRSARLRSAIRTSAPAWQKTQETGNERPQLPLGVHGRELRRRGARLLSGLAPRRLRARRARGGRDRRSCSPSATSACCRRRSERAAASPSSSAGTSRSSLCPRRRPTSSSKAASSSPGSDGPSPSSNVEAPVVLASAPAPHPQPAPLEEGERRAAGAGATASSAAQLMQQASLKIPVREPMQLAEPIVRLSRASSRSEAGREEGSARQAIAAKAEKASASKPAKPAPTSPRRPPKPSRQRGQESWG